MAYPLAAASMLIVGCSIKSLSMAGNALGTPI
jgi:hypothetical protein